MPSFQLQGQSLNFYIFLFIWIIVLFAFFSQSFLLLRCLKTERSDRLSGVLLINIGFWCANTLCIMFFYTYAILYMEDEEKSGIYMQLSAFSVSAFSLGVSLSISFLSLERILIIVRMNVHGRYKKKFVVATATLCSLLTVLIFGASLWLDWPLQANTVCKTLQCSLGDAGYLVNTGKMVIGLMNVFMCVVFYVILWRYVKGNEASRTHFKKANLLVGISIFCDLIFNFSTRLTMLVCGWLGISSNGVVGTFAATMAGLYCLTAALVYLFILCPKRMNVTGKVGSTDLSKPRSDR